MIESISDFLSIAVTGVLCLLGIYYLYIAIAQHRFHVLQRMEESYYRFYDESDEEDQDNEVLQ
ncbi:MAG: hypothetical protein K6E41_06355 [Solobacterium sp.]|nr:hypothetical protein [Solobacterium sp.]